MEEFEKFRETFGEYPTLISFISPGDENYKKVLRYCIEHKNPNVIEVFEKFFEIDVPSEASI